MLTVHQVHSVERTQFCICRRCSCRLAVVRMTSRMLCCRANALNSTSHYCPRYADRLPDPCGSPYCQDHEPQNRQCYAPSQITFPFFGDILGFIGALGTGPTTFWIPSLMWLIAKKPGYGNVRDSGLPLCALHHNPDSDPYLNPDPQSLSYRPRSASVSDLLPRHCVM